MKIAVVLLNWNGKSWLKKFLPDVLKHTTTPDTQVFVADNASKDGSQQLVKKHFPEAGLIELEKNYGFAGGYNQALARIDAQYYVLLNTDVAVPQGWLEPLYQRMESDTAIAAVMPKIKSWHKPEYFEYAGAAGGFIDYLGYPFCRGRILDEVEADNGQYDDAREIFWATGAAMMIRAGVFNEVEGFDADFFAHMEEIDLCWRIRNRGYKIFYEPAAAIYHVGGGTLPNESPHKLFLNFRNNLYLLYKNLPEEELRALIFYRKLLDGAAALTYLLKGEGHNVKAVWRAHRAFNAQIRHTKAKRVLLRMAALEDHSGTIYPKSLIWQHFIKKVKRFSELKW